MIDLFVNPGSKLSDLQTQFLSLWQLVGNTPLIRIGYCYKGNKEVLIDTKCEQFSLTGSIKDRITLYILQQAYLQHQISPGDNIVEVTSGNTGVAFAAIVVHRSAGRPALY